MKPIPFFVVVCAFLAAAYASSIAGTQPAASADLRKTLKAIQELDPASVLGLQVWASYPKPEAPSPILSALDEAEAEILTLKPDDREAVMSWLEQNGRGKLHAQGASDADIGACVPEVDPKNCSLSATQLDQAATSAGSYRDLSFALASGADAGGGIAIERGFAIVKSDATSETHCLTFKNVGPKEADAVTFVYRLQARTGAVIDAGSSVRAGSFSPGMEVRGPSSAGDLVNPPDGSDKSQLDNCWTRSAHLAPPALLRATSITIGVASVTYNDGTHWSLGQ